MFIKTPCPRAAGWGAQAMLLSFRAARFRRRNRVQKRNRRFKSTRFLPLSRLPARRRDPGPGGQGNKSPRAESSARAERGAQRRLREAGWELGEPRKSWRQVGTERGGRAALLPSGGSEPCPLLVLLLLPHPTADPRDSRGGRAEQHLPAVRGLDVGCGEAAAVNPTGGPGAARPGAEPRREERTEARGSRRARPQVAAAAGSRGGGAARQRGAGPRREGRGGARPLGGAAGGAIAVPREGQRRGLRGAVARCRCAPRAAVRSRAARFALEVLASLWVVGAVMRCRSAWGKKVKFQSAKKWGVRGSFRVRALSTVWWQSCLVVRGHVLPPAFSPSQVPFYSWLINW